MMENKVSPKEYLSPEKHRKCSTAQIQLKILRFVGFGYIA